MSAKCSKHLEVTSPPYWTLKKYPDGPGQLGDVADYESFLHELDKVWNHALRILVPGGRLIVRAASEYVRAVRSLSPGQKLGELHREFGDGLLNTLRVAP
jgi:DNA modification methylase